MTESPNDILKPQILANDLCEVQQIYANFFTSIDITDWEKPVKGGSKEPVSPVI